MRHRHCGESCRRTATPSALDKRASPRLYVELREDACGVHKGSLPRAVAAFANLAILELRLLGKENVRRAMSKFNQRPNTAVGVVWSATAARTAL